MLAHIAGLPLEELFAAAVAGGALGIASLRDLVRRSAGRARHASAFGAQQGGPGRHAGGLEPFQERGHEVAEIAAEVQSERDPRVAVQEGRSQGQ